MRIDCVQIREEALLRRLLNLWESAVMETHTFLTKAEIVALRPAVLEGLQQVETLLCARGEKAEELAFAGISDGVLEMLFVMPRQRGKGIGKRLVTLGVAAYNVRRLDVNEQNPQAVGFYQQLGFRVRERMEWDRAGRPYPLLMMELSLQPLRALLLDICQRAWMERDGALLRCIFAADVIYCGSCGVECKGIEAVLSRLEACGARVEAGHWGVRCASHDRDQTVVEWYACCDGGNGSMQRHDGVSLVTWTGEDCISGVKALSTPFPHDDSCSGNMSKKRKGDG